MSAAEETQTQLHNAEYQQQTALLLWPSPLHTQEWVQHSQPAVTHKPQSTLYALQTLNGKKIFIYNKTLQPTQTHGHKMWNLWDLHVHVLLFLISSSALEVF